MFTWIHWGWNDLLQYVLAKLHLLRITEKIICSLVFCDPSCHVNAECTLSGGSTSCICAIGYTGDGLTCDGEGIYLLSVQVRDLFLVVDVDECDTGVCSENADCTNTVGSYTCQCQSGFSGDGQTCTGK